MMALLLPLFFSTTIQAASLCQDPSACSTEMKEILERHQTATRPTFLTLTGTSGDCYYLHPSYKPNQRHHGGFVFEPQNSQVFAAGLFAFFYKDNPYRKLNAQQMKELFAQSGSTLRPLWFKQSEALLPISGDPNSQEYVYSIRQDDKGLLVIGQLSPMYGKPTAIFCSLDFKVL